MSLRSPFHPHSMLLHHNTFLIMQDGLSPLQLAAVQGHAGIVKILLDSGVHVDGVGRVSASVHINFARMPFKKAILFVFNF